MANKSSREQRVRQNKRKIYEQLCAKLNVFYYVALGVCALILILFFCPWTQNYQYITGKEENVLNGWQYFAAGISGRYDTAGDLGDFFNIYAQAYTQTLAVLTLVAFLLLVLVVASAIATLATKKHSLSFLAIVLEVLLIIVLIASCAVAFSMKNSNIYKVYCDPAQCEMRSYVMFPIVAAVGLLAVHIVAAVKYLSARKYLNA